MVGSILPPIADGHGVGRADIGARGHGGHVRRLGDEDPGGGGPGPAGRDKDDHRHPGVGDGLDDLPHGAIQPPRGVQLHHQGFGLLLLRLFDACQDEFRQAGVHGTHCVQVVNGPGRGPANRGRKQQGEYDEGKNP